MPSEQYVLRLRGKRLAVTRPTAVRQRLLGLLVRPPLAPGEALWLDPCGGVHTWALRQAIDVLFLNARQEVLAVARNLRPWRLAWAPPGTASVLELRAGEAAAICPGDRLQMEAA